MTDRVRGLTDATEKNERFFDAIRVRTSNSWGRNPTKLGAALYRAVLTEELLDTLALQDDEAVSDARVRELLVAGRDWIDAQVERQFG